MKRILIGLILLLNMVLVGCNNNDVNSTNKNAQVVSKIKVLPAKDVDEFLKRPNIGIIDARTKAEYESGTLDERAIFMEVQKGPKAKESIANLDGELEKLDKNKSWLVYCGKGPRSMGLAEEMEKLGFKDVSIVEGGILGYREYKK